MAFVRVGEWSLLEELLTLPHHILEPYTALGTWLPIYILNVDIMRHVR